MIVARIVVAYLRGYGGIFIFVVVGWIYNSCIIIVETASCELGQQIKILNIR